MRPNTGVTRRLWLYGHILALAILGACAQAPSGTPTWRDTWAGGDIAKLRSAEALDRDGSRCEYEKTLAQASATAPGPNPWPAQTQTGQAISNLGHAAFGGPDLSRLFFQCMRARGWEFKGYQ